VLPLRRTASPAGGRARDGRRYRDDEACLTRFAASRDGVEVYIEPLPAVTDATAVSPSGTGDGAPDPLPGPGTVRSPDTTVLMVADTGEWIRRQVPGPQAAYHLARRLGIPAHDASVVGYPQRMREWSSRLAREAKARREP
jgi:hypothetical protein